MAKYTREVILNTLNKQMEIFQSFMRGLTPAQLSQPCTDSEVPGAAPWTPKDHIPHAARVERAFVRLVESTIAGEADPIGIVRGGGSGKGTDFASWVHQSNQQNVEENHDRSLDDLLASLDKTRARTLTFLEGLSDEQLTMPVPSAPWADSTVGGILATIGHHQVQHLNWIKEGLSKQETLSNS